jgi:protoheme IX farnesyltransferase
MVISGGAAVGAWADPGVLLLSLLVFLWTPIHFWSLAMVYREDYSRADVPMLPVKVDQRRAAVWSLLHGIGAVGAGIWLAALPGNGLAYAVPIALAGAVLLYGGGQLVISPTRRFAGRLFHISNLYLFVVLLAVCVAAAA